MYIGVRDRSRAAAFYGAVLPILGWRASRIDPDRPYAAWRPLDQPRPVILVGRPWNGEPASPGNGQMVALLAGSRPAVDAFHAAACANGGTCDGPPGLRPEYHPDYYGAYVRDPEGNKLCACCHDPA